MSQYHLSALAALDLADIADYTTDVWGAKQATDLALKHCSRVPLDKGEGFVKRRLILGGAAASHELPRG